MSKVRKGRKPKELTEEQFEILIRDVDSFNEQFFIYLAGTDKYEVVPTVTDQGQPMTKEQYTLVKNECSRLGLSVIYKMDLPDGSTVYTSIENNKVGCIQDGIH